MLNPPARQASRVWQRRGRRSAGAGEEADHPIRGPPYQARGCLSCACYMHTTIDLLLLALLNLYISMFYAVKNGRGFPYFMLQFIQLDDRNAVSSVCQFNGCYSPMVFSLNLIPVLGRGSNEPRDTGLAGGGKNWLLEYASLAVMFHALCCIHNPLHKLLNCHV